MSLIQERLKESVRVKERIIGDAVILEQIQRASETMARSLKSGGKLLLCGNGGSASDALHFAGEIVGRFQRERPSWPAIALGAGLASLTALSNDYGYEDALAREATAYGRPGDVLTGISASGQSPNIIRAVMAAKSAGCYTVGLLGRDGGKISALVDCPIVVPSDVTARIQESHIAIIHIMCELVENIMTGNES